MSRLLILPALLALAGCQLPEVRVGANEGVPAVEGTTEVSLDNFVCGQPIAAGTDTATTRKVDTGCELTFTREVQLLDDADYEANSDLASFSGLLEAVEIDVTRFELIDAATGEALDPESRILWATLSVNGQVVADKPTLTSLPQKVRLGEQAVGPIKDQLSRRAPVSLTVTAVVVMPDEPPLPASLRFEYEAQPTLVLAL